MGAGDRSLEAMTVLCKSLSEIEAGKVAVISFGEKIRCILPFDKIFRNEDGPQIV